MDFRTPKRRKTRQKSGFNVAGETPGSECKIRKSSRLLFKNNTASFQIYKKSLISKPLFLNEIGLIFFGGYIKPEKEITIYLTIKYTIDSVVESETREISIEANKWNKFGIIAKVNIIKPTKIDNINCEIKIISETNNIGYLDLFGLSIDAINYEYFLDNDVEDIFWQKNNIYIPEISYTNFDGIFLATFKDKSIELKNGEFIILKSCNRCSRFLPIDILNERNTLSFSNHCVKKYPCTHNAFSKYKIIESDYSEIPKELSKNIEGDKIISYFGHQLECKSCKKFFVNAPLNPLRNSTQHREDSLRRRCIEVLVDTLLKREWIYHKFRIKEKKEFDRFIWNKFDKKCFKCNKELESPREWI